MIDITVTEALGIHAPAIQHQFPFSALQTEHVTGPAFMPEFMETARHGRFCRLPIHDKGAVIWCFTTERARDTFIADFGGTILTN